MTRSVDRTVKTLTILFAVLICHADGQSACTTPSGGVGTCKSVYQCDELLYLINKIERTPDDEDFLQKSQCGLQGPVPSLCCPETCNTLENQRGRCVSIFKCTHLLNLLRLPVSEETIQYLQNSRCLDSKEYTVCCGPPPVPELGSTTIESATIHPMTPLTLPPARPSGPPLNVNPGSTTAAPETSSPVLTSTLPPDTPTSTSSTVAPSTNGVESRKNGNETGSTCTTPRGEVGTCKSIRRCEETLRLVTKINRTAQETEFLKSSQCGFEEGSPAVCCPQSCFTPDGKPGKCVKILFCPHLANILEPPATQENILYFRNSRCEDSEKNSVCCGPPPDLGPPPKGNCAATVSAFPPDPRTGCCGVDSRVDDEEVAPGITRIDQYPWLVRVEYTFNKKSYSLCVGALISGKYVVTTAQCATDSVVKPTNVRLGEYNTTNEGPDCVPLKSGGMQCTEGSIVIPIEEFIWHPGYNPEDPVKGNDITLIRMQRIAPFTDFIRPICLPQDDVTAVTPTPNLTMYAAGWGYASKKNPNSQIKLHVDLPYVSLKTCQARYDPKFKTLIRLWHKQVCAGGVVGKDTCEGDSGSPLMYQNGRTFEIIGVTSYGSIPCGTNIPGIYTKIYEYNAWIRMQIRP